MVVRVAAMGVANAWIVGRFLRTRSGVSAASMSFRFPWDWAGLVIVAIVFVIFGVSIAFIIHPRDVSRANLLVSLVVSSGRRCGVITVAAVLDQYRNLRPTKAKWHPQVRQDSNPAETLDTNPISQNSEKAV